MKKTGFIGREKEYRILENCYESPNASLVIVSGRRRVGKTFLINEIFEGDFAFKITGARGQSMQEQLENFKVELEKKTGKKYKALTTWKEAFNNLEQYLSSLKQKSVVFFDEMPWMDTPKSNFLTEFEYFWNNYGSANKKILFIVCGSSASWLDEKIINNKGGLYDRHSANIQLEPFSLAETKLFLNSKDIYWSDYDIVRLYMIVGGIPYYLNLLDRRMSLNENIDYLFFSNNALLKNEFDRLYKTLFTSGDNYIEVVRVLSTKRSGMTKAEIASKTKFENNGYLTKILSTLIVCGFIKSFGRLGNKKETYYLLTDYFSLFYLRFLDGKSGLDNHYWANSYDNKQRLIFEALNFEIVCYDHIECIRKELSINGVLSNHYSWYLKGNEENNGAQIDLVIDRKDKIYTICEIKFFSSEFVVDKKYDLELRNKINVFNSNVKTKKTIQLVLITTYGLEKNTYSNIFNKVITIDSFFK